MKEETAPTQTTIPLAEQLLDALILCLPIMEAEYSSYGPREPETRALQAARSAVEHRNILRSPPM